MVLLNEISIKLPMNWDEISRKKNEFYDYAISNGIQRNVYTSEKYRDFFAANVAVLLKIREEFSNQVKFLYL